MNISAMPAKSNTDSNNVRIQSVERALQVIELLVAHPSGLSVAEIARSLGLNRSTASHLVSTLVLRWWLTSTTERGRYRISPKLGALAHAVNQSGGVLANFHRLGQQLTAETGETTHLAVLSGVQIVHVGVVTHPTQLGVSSHPGSAADAYCSALGKALLAWSSASYIEEYLKSTYLKGITAKTITSAQSLKKELDRVRSVGYAFDNEESSAGVRCVAVPVGTSAHSGGFAVSITGPASRLTINKARKLVPKLQEFARLLSDEPYSKDDVA